MQVIVGNGQAAREAGRSKVPSLAELAVPGFELWHQAGELAAVGVPLALSVREWNAAPDTKIRQEVATLAAAGVPLSLALLETGRGDAGVRNLRRFVDSLPVSREQPGARLPDLCLASAELPPGAFEAITASLPACVTRIVQLDNAALATEDTWSVLWRARDAGSPLLPAYGPLARSGCSLLADEAARAVLPGCAVQVPVESAWLPLALHLTAFANRAGRLDTAALAAAIDAGLNAADRLLDLLDWPANVADDARRNRRLAIMLGGLGELVARRKLDPRRLDTLEWLLGVVAEVRGLLWRRSAELAAERGCLPALHDADPSLHWPDAAGRRKWRHQWQAALQQSGVRHRNLLVISPYAVLPVDGGDARYMDLLPAIGAADAYFFGDSPVFDGWHYRDYVAFHRRAAAVIRNGLPPGRCRRGVT